MKIVGVVGAGFVLTSLLFGCDNSGVATSADPAAKAAMLAGVWNCVTKTGADAGPGGVTETQTFTADGWYSSSKYPEGKKYAYRFEKGNLVISMPIGDWTEKITTLTNDALEYQNDRADGPTKVSCKR